MPFILGKLSDDARFENSDSPELPHHGVYTGKDGITKFFANIGGAFDVKSFDPKTYLSSADEVMTTGSWTCVVRSTGKSFSANWAMRFLFQGGKITFAHVYEDMRPERGEGAGTRRRRLGISSTSAASRSDRTKRTAKTDRPAPARR